VRRWCVLLIAVACALARVRVEAQPTREQSLHRAADVVYSYTDDRGRLVYVNRLDDVPLRLRPYAARVDQPDAGAATADGTGTSQPLAALLAWVAAPEDTDKARATAKPAGFYRYKGRGGRWVFTNTRESVPLEQRAAAAFDPSQVSLNSQLGNALDQQLKARFDTLRESPVCRRALQDDAEPWWRRVWREHPGSVACAAALLVFFLITPAMARSVGGATWARTLSVAIPVLGCAGIVSYLLMQSGRSWMTEREHAKPCKPAAWAEASQSSQPLVQHAKLVNALKEETRLLEQIHAESE
jgi:hypothetical protein